MKPRLEEFDEAYNRPYHTKRLLVDMSGAPGDETVDYQTLLTWLCRSDNVLQSFLCALTVLEGNRSVYCTEVLRSITMLVIHADIHSSMWCYLS